MMRIHLKRDEASKRSGWSNKRAEEMYLKNNEFKNNEFKKKSGSSKILS